MSIGPQQPESLLGRVVAGYELIRYIGTGATGYVFQGKRATSAPGVVELTGKIPLEFPEDAAIKLLVPPFGATPDELADFQRRFLREAQTLAQLDHPHILPIIDFGEDSAAGYFYMVLRYMAGGSLARLIAERGPLPLDEVNHLLAQIADALDYAHSRGIVHRDVKPGNILLDTSGAAYLGDFSIVRLLSDAATQRTTTGRLMGTPAYMAPEQFDDSSRVGPSADIYGLGMVVYEMVTGRAAFGSTSWAQVMKQQLQEAPAPPRAARPDLLAPAEAAIMKALEKDPARRFDTAAAFSRAFSLGLQGEWAEGLSRTVEPAWGVPYVAPDARTQPGGSAAIESAPSRRRNRLGLLVAAVAALLILTCGAGLAFGNAGPSLLAAFFGHATPSATALGTGTPGGPTQTAGPANTAIPGAPTATTRGPVNNPVVSPPTATSTPSLPDLDITAGAHGSGNPYVITTAGPYHNVTIEAGAYATGIGQCSQGGSGTVRITATGVVTIAGTLTVQGEGYCGGRETAGAAGGWQGASPLGPGIQASSPNGGGGSGGGGADSGGGGGGYGSNGGAAQSGEAGGSSYGNATLATLFLGSGGGSSGAQSGGTGGAGGDGGGAIFIQAGAIIVTGTISANGQDGESKVSTGSTNYRGGGGGSGGSIYLHANTVSLGGNLVTATGGQGGYGIHDNTWAISGGPGGVGRIYVEYTQSVSGSTSPPAYEAKV